MSRSAAVVTGAGRGVGRATALALAAKGLDVALLGRAQGELDLVAAEVKARGTEALAVPCDVGVEADVTAAQVTVEAAFGAPRVVVNNAGIVRRGSVEHMAVADWSAVLATNLTGPFLVTRAFLPSMRARGVGRIVMVSSISATLGTARQSAYAASKWGLHGLLKSLAEELRGTGLAAMGVVPGSIDTAMLEGSGFSPQMTADEVAAVIAFLALEAPAAMNGSAVEMFGP